MARTSGRLLSCAGRIAGAAALATAGVAGYTGWTLNARRRPWPDYRMTPFEVGVDAEDVAFTAADQTHLAGWWMDRPGSDLVVIVCHGHRGSMDQMLGIGPGLWRRGHAVMMFDFRGCGDSEDGPQSLALHERQDLAAAIDWVAARRPDAKVVVLGFSMGAATALLVAADDPRVAAVVADSPFADMADVVAANYRRHRLPGQPFLPFADAWNRVRWGYSFAQVRPIDAIARLAPRPVLLLHGDSDRVIPHSDLGRLVEAAQNPTLEEVTFEGADHCGGYFQDRPGYIDRVDDVLRRRLG